MDEARRKARRRSLRNLRRSSSNFSFANTSCLEPCLNEEGKGADESTIIENYGSAWIRDENVNPVIAVDNTKLVQDTSKSSYESDFEPAACTVEDGNIRLPLSDMDIPLKNYQEQMVRGKCSSDLAEKKCNAGGLLNFGFHEQLKLNGVVKDPGIEFSSPLTGVDNECTARPLMEGLLTMDLNQYDPVYDWFETQSNKPCDSTNRSKLEKENKLTSDVCLEYCPNVSHGITKNISNFSNDRKGLISPFAEIGVQSTSDLSAGDANGKPSHNNDVLSSASELKMKNKVASQYIDSKGSPELHSLERLKNPGAELASEIESSSSINRTSSILGMDIKTVIQSLASRLEALSSISSNDDERAIKASDTSNSMKSLPPVTSKQLETISDNSTLFSKNELSISKDLTSTCAVVKTHKRRLSLKKQPRPAEDREENQLKMIDPETVAEPSMEFMHEPLAAGSDMKCNESHIHCDLKSDDPSSKDTGEDASNEMHGNNLPDSGTNEAAETAMDIDFEVASLAQELSLRFITDNVPSKSPKSRLSGSAARRRSSRLFTPPEPYQLHSSSSDARVCDQELYSDDGKNAYCIENVYPNSVKTSLLQEHEQLNKSKKGKRRSLDGNSKMQRKPKMQEVQCASFKKDVEMSKNSFEAFASASSLVKDPNCDNAVFAVQSDCLIPDDVEKEENTLHTTLSVCESLEEKKGIPIDVPDSESSFQIISNDLKIGLAEDDISGDQEKQCLPVHQTRNSPVDEYSDQMEDKLALEPWDPVSMVDACILERGKSKRSQRTCRKKSWVLPTSDESETSSLLLTKHKKGGRKMPGKADEDTSKLEFPQEETYGDLEDSLDDFEVNEDLRLLYLNKQYQPPPAMQPLQTIKEDPPYRNVFSKKGDVRLLTFKEGWTHSRMLKRHRKAKVLSSLSQNTPVSISEEEFQLKMASIQKMLDS